MGLLLYRGFFFGLAPVNVNCGTGPIYASKLLRFLDYGFTLHDRFLPEPYTDITIRSGSKNYRINVVLTYNTNPYRLLTGTLQFGKAGNI